MHDNVIASLLMNVFRSCLYYEPTPIVVTKKFKKGDPLVEYACKLIEYAVAIKREEIYSQDDDKITSYLMYLRHRDKP